ncbi:MAG: hypothetical protein H6917_00830 [Novosphingobium sp.]|nr:hypothetical protein [Novosphingobium sp.]MCP5400913.1 hypothetical protein [Novosphingobium sp.]
MALTLEFDGDSRTLVYDPIGSDVMIDGQLISIDPAALMATASATMFG